MDAGKFITFEGGEGAGKSTQVALLAGYLRDRGNEVVLTREPGGSPGAEQIRDLLVKGDIARWEGITEALLNYAARIEHLSKTVRPALNDGQWVISDRFADSTMAYQGYGHGLGREKVETLHTWALGDFAPDLTLILDLAVEDGLKRATDNGGGEDRYERMERDFHQRLRQGFLDIAAREPQRCAVIDGAGSIEAVQEAIREAVNSRLGLS